MAVQAGGHGGLEILRHLPRSGSAGAEGYSAVDRIAFWNAVHLVLLVPVAALTWLAWKRLGAAFGAYALATLVVVLTAPSRGFPLVSLPRYLLADFPILMALAALFEGRPNLRTGVLVGLGALSAAAGVAFSRGIWIA